MDSPVLLAETLVPVPCDVAKAWFLELGDHPERYVFDSHAGFVFTHGEFAEPGARFQTRERFAGLLSLVLKFELVDVAEHRFVFEVTSPIRGIWGYFELEPVAVGGTHLRLAVGSGQSLRRRLLALPPVHSAIQHQIEGEVEHIAASMASLYKDREAQAWES